MLGTFRIYQPGSSIATSYSEGESSQFPKHFGLLEIHEVKFRLQAIPYSRIRQFIYEDIVLSDVAGLDARDPNVEDRIQEVLTAKVKTILRTAQATRIQSEDDGDADVSYGLIDPDKIIIRLRVFHAGFTTLNQQRFGTLFIGKVANPSDLLLFSKKPKDGADRVGPANGPAERGSNRYRSEFDALSLTDGMEALNPIRVEELVEDALHTQNKQLQLLTACKSCFVETFGYCCVVVY